MIEINRIEYLTNIIMENNEAEVAGQMCCSVGENEITELLEFLEEQGLDVFAIRTNMPIVRFRDRDLEVWKRIVLDTETYEDIYEFMMKEGKDRGGITKSVYFHSWVDMGVGDERSIMVYALYDEPFEKPETDDSLEGVAPI